MALLKFLVIFFIIFFVGRLLLRVFMPFAFRKLAERLMQKAQQSAGGPGADQYMHGNPYDQFKGAQGRQRKDGEVRVDYVPKEEAKERKGTQTAGEFIDFEEIKN